MIISLIQILAFPWCRRDKVVLCAVPGSHTRLQSPNRHRAHPFPCFWTGHHLVLMSYDPYKAGQVRSRLQNSRDIHGTRETNIYGARATHPIGLVFSLYNMRSFLDASYSQATFPIFLLFYCIVFSKM